MSSKRYGWLIGLFALACLGEAEAQVAGGLYLQLEVSGDTYRSGAEGEPELANWETLLALRRATSDPGVRGLWIDLERSPSIARAQELRGALRAMRQSGREVIVHAESGLDTIGYYLASAANRIALSPFSMLELTGLRLEATFLRGAFEKSGLTADILRSGRFVAAAEILTRESMSESFREMADSVLEGIYSEVVHGIAEGRETTVEQIQTWMSQGPYSAMPAARAELGLIDDVGHRDELIEKLRGRVTSDLSIRGLGEYARSQPQVARPDRIALVSIDGLLIHGESRHDAVLGKLEGSSTLAALLREIRASSGVRAVVLRVESPGGSLLAADLVRREVELLARAKPVVVSFGDIGGGAAYFFAAPAQRILAMPTTLTGSIGLMEGEVNWHQVLTRLGVEKELLRRGQIPPATATDVTQARSRRQSRLNEQYRQAVARIAADRQVVPKLSADFVDSAGKGRIWTGRQALEFRLIDELGGLDEAIARAQELAGLSMQTIVPLAPASTTSVDWWQRLRQVVGASITIDVPIEEGWEGPAAVLGLFSWIGTEGPLMMQPLDLVVR
ncbi:MAG: S49 family peptidase [Planctomycetota bacterium]